MYASEDDRAVMDIGKNGYGEGLRTREVELVDPAWNADHGSSGRSMGWGFSLCVFWLKVGRDAKNV